VLVATPQAGGLVASRTSLHLRLGSPPASPAPPGLADYSPSWQPPMLISEIGLAPRTQSTWEAAGIQDTDELRRPAPELLILPGITGSILYETVYRLHDHHIRLRADGPRISVPTRLDLEMLRMRIVDGVSLREIGTAHHLSAERVRQRLHLQFGLTGEPPAAAERRQTRLIMRPELERMIALRLYKCEQGMPMSLLLAGFATGSITREARAAIARLESKGFLTIDGDRARPTLLLHRITCSDRTSGIHRCTGSGWMER
jgi:hypothetical protein